jgi:hypothetical protein
MKKTKWQKSEITTKQRKQQYGHENCFELNNLKTKIQAHLGIQKGSLIFFLSEHRNITLSCHLGKMHINLFIFLCIFFNMFTVSRKYVRQFIGFLVLIIQVLWMYHFFGLIGTEIIYWYRHIMQTIICSILLILSFNARYSARNCGLMLQLFQTWIDNVTLYRYIMS